MVPQPMTMTRSRPGVVVDFIGGLVDLLVERKTRL
jgi:hypothetical protein